jgi:hypothetical protein
MWGMFYGGERECGGTEGMNFNSKKDAPEVASHSLFELWGILFGRLRIILQSLSPTGGLVLHLIRLSSCPRNLTEELRRPGVRVMEVFNNGTRFQQKLVIRWLKICRFFAALRFWSVFFRVWYHKGYDVANVYRKARWGGKFFSNAIAQTPPDSGTKNHG